MIEYPHYFEGQTTVEGDPLFARLPHMLVMDAEPLLPRGSSVLDVGACDGTSGTYLALAGHKVHSIELNPDYIENGRRIISALGGLALANTMVQGDMRNLNFEAEFDAVIATGSLQLVTMPEARQVIRKLRAATKPGGLNIINAFIATPDQQALIPNRALFEPEELYRLYQDAGWIIDHPPKTKLFQLTTSVDEGILHYWNTSTEQLIARKPDSAREVARRALVAEAQLYRHADPGLYDDLMEQAAAL